MKKSLIAALIVLSLLLAVAIGVVVYMENKSNDDPAESTPAASDTNPDDTQENPSEQESETEDTAVETTEETVGISLPTEDPNEVGPEYTWPENDTEPDETAAPGDPDATWDPDENETPEMGA